MAHKAHIIMAKDGDDDVHMENRKCFIFFSGSFENNFQGLCHHVGKMHTHTQYSETLAKIQRQSPVYPGCRQSRETHTHTHKGGRK